MDFFRRSNWDIIGKSNLFFAISGVLIVLLTAVWAVRGLNYGIDFTGGTLLRYKAASPLAETPAQEVEVISKVRAALAEQGLEKSQIQLAGGDTLLIRTYAVANDEEAAERDAKVKAAIEKLFGDKHGPIESLGRETVGPVVGADLRKAAIKALVIGQLLILIYITVRYEIRFAVAGILALVHDVLMLTGIMAALQVELNSWFVAVVLTVIGYSMNDSVIIFDRIRENRSRHRHAPLGPIINASLLETMTRSINTTVTTLFTLIALFFLAGPVLQGFALAMIVGITLGAYSSIFIAAPFVALWDRLARQRAGAGAGARPAYATATASASANGAGASVGEDEEAEGGAKVSAVETMQRAAEAAQEEKRRARRERRAKKRAKKRGKSKKR
ncbi:MAG: protein translocase subunit SecF [Armatimonadetes bacterium]|nr:protein translocase subunit SecF [Armatimonadota bacterium]